MSLQSAINDWRADYDETRINEYNPDYIGSIRDTSGVYHTGPGIYQTGSNAIYTFNVYAGQGVDHDNPTLGGSKYLVYSNAGFSWNTIDEDGNGKYEFVTSGNLDGFILGYTPTGDYNPSPAEATLGAFDFTQPFLAVDGFSIAVNYAASLFGAADGNSAIDVSATASDGTTLSSRSR